MAKKSRVRAHSLAHSTLEGQKGMLELQDGIRKIDKQLFTYMDLHKTK
jgi:hypothetical protein